MTERRVQAGSGSGGGSGRARRARGGQDGPTYLHSVDEIGDALRARIRELVEQWELQGYEDGHDFVALNPLRNDQSLGSFRVVLSGRLQGLVKDFAGGPALSPLKFTALLWFRGDMGQAVRWSLGFLGWDGTNPDAMKKTRAAIERAEKRDEAHEKDVLEQRSRAKARYLQGVSIHGSPVETYLAGRGLFIRKLPFEIRGLRHHGRLWNVESNRHWDGMLASIVGPDGQFLGLHRTWLEVHGDGSVTKAPLAEPKRTMGEYRGGLMRVWGGIRVDPETGEIKRQVKLGRLSKAGAKEPAELDITEGIEDALAVALAFPEARVAAGVSIDNLKSLRLPEVVTRVRFWKQNDAPGSPADKAFQKVVEAQLLQGKQVQIVRPQGGFHDAAEIMQQTKGA